MDEPGVDVTEGDDARREPVAAGAGSRPLIVPVLGSVASASTWAFNIVRGLLAANDPRALSLYAEHADPFLANLPLDASAVALKTHCLDRGMLALLSRVGARIVVTVRDPRDSVASQHGRFGLGFRFALSQVSRFFATVASLGPTAAVLVLRYEDGFAADPDTLAALQAHLGVSVPAATAAALFEANTPESVREWIDQWAEAAHLDDEAKARGGEHWSETTHWHPRHVGDGSVGKWAEMLTAEQAEAVARAVPLDLSDRGWSATPLQWSPLLFDDGQGAGLPHDAVLRCTGAERLLVVGPRLFLPAGRWRVTILVEPTEPGETIRLKVELGTERGGPQALRIVTVPRHDEGTADLDYEHLDHFDAIEVKVSSLPDNRRAQAVFEGVRLTWAGALDPRPLLLARPIR